MGKNNRNGQSTILNRNQVECICSNLPEKYSLLAELMYFSSGRVKEISTLKVKNLNFKDGILTIEKSSTKTKESRQVPIHPRTMLHLKSWIDSNDLNNDDYIFFTDSRNTNFRNGENPISTQSIDKYFRISFDWIGIVGASTHSFRRSRLTHLMEEGWNIREIQDISGHNSMVSLQKYLDTDKSNTFEKYKKLFDKE